MSRMFAVAREVIEVESDQEVANAALHRLYMELTRIFSTFPNGTKVIITVQGREPDKDKEAA